MAGRAHAAGYRTATTLFGTDRPDVRLVAIADTNTAVADDTAKRYGYERAEYDWQAIADARISTRSASWSPTICTARSSRDCWPPVSTCCVRSRWRGRLPMPRRWYRR